MNRSRLQTLGGELVIVVIGILIALTIDQGVADRGERRLEAEYLAALRTDFQSTVDWLEYGEDINVRKERRIRELDAIRDGASTVPVDTTAVAYSLALLTFHPIFPVPRATFDDLTETGNLRVLQDAQLRRRLVDFYLWVETFSVHERAMVDRSGKLKGAIDGLFSPALLAEVADVGWNAGPDAWAPLEVLVMPESLKAEAADSDVLDRMRASPTLSSVLSTAMDDVYLQRRQYELVGERARSVLEALEEALS